MTLNQELQQDRAKFRIKAPETVQTTMAQATENLADSGIIDRTLKVGDRILLFTLNNATQKSFSVKTALEKVLLYWLSIVVAGVPTVIWS